MKKLILIGTVLVTIHSYAAIGVIARDNFYIGALAGYGKPMLSKTEYSSVANDNSTSSQVGSTTWSGFIGYKGATSPHWLTGLELGYDDNGKAKYHYFNDGDATVYSRDVNLLLTETYLFDNGFNMFAKAGIARVYQKTVGQAVSDDGKKELIRTRPLAKAGFGYLFDFGKNGNLNVFVQYTHLFANNGRDDGIDKLNRAIISTNTIGIGLSYEFPT